MIIEGATAPKVNIYTRALLPQKFLPKHFSFCFQSLNTDKSFLDKGVELVGEGSVIFFFFLFFILLQILTNINEY